MAKQLTLWELETVLIALDRYRAEVEREGNLTAVVEGIDELGRHFYNKAEKKSEGWGVQVDTVWG